jgi:hypothetical protein
MKCLPEIVVLLLGILIMAVLVYLIAASEGLVQLLAILGLAAVYLGWQGVLVKWGWRSTGKDPDDLDFHLPG